MNFGRAFLAGVVGGAVMTVIMAFVRVMGMNANPEMMLGTMMGGPPDTTRWVLGLIIHLILSGLIAVLYAIGFEFITHRAGWLVGLGLSIIHIIIGGLVMGMMGSMHPMVPARMPAPGPFMSGMGMMGVGLFVIEHLIYGAIVGAMYKVTAEHRRGVPSPA